MVKRQQAWFFEVLLHLHKLLCGTVVFHLLHQLSLFLMKKWQVHVISLWMCPTTVKQLFRCTATAYLSCSLSSSQNVSNGSPTQGLHMCLYTWWLCTLYFTTNWLLKVAVVLSPSAMFTFIFLQPVGLCTESVRCLDRHCSCFLLAGIDGPVCFKMNQLGSYQVPECENYTSEQ